MLKLLFFVIVLFINLSAQRLTNNFQVDKKIKGGAKCSGEFNVVNYTVKSADGAVIYTITIETEFDTPFSELKIFENGSSVLVNAFKATLTFYDSQGNKNSESSIRKNSNVNYERSIKAIVDNDNLVIACKNDKDTFSTIQIYNSENTLIKEFLPEIENIIGLSYSKVHERIFVSHNTWSDSGELENYISIFDEDGNLLSTHSSNFENGFIIEDQFVGYSNKNIISINAESLELLFEKRIGKGELFIDVTAEKRSNVYAVTSKSPTLKKGKWFYKNLTITKYDSQGKIIFKHKKDTEPFLKYGFSFLNGKLQFNMDDHMLFLK